MPGKLRLGLVGCGNFGKELARYFLEVADIAALCDVHPDGMKETAKELGLDVPHYTEYEKMFAAGGRHLSSEGVAQYGLQELPFGQAHVGETKISSRRGRIFRGTRDERGRHRGDVCVLAHRRADQVWNDETRLRAIIEYPVKTMNTNRERNVYQVDTGLIAFLDLSERHDRKGNMYLSESGDWSGASTS